MSNVNLSPFGGVGWQFFDNNGAPLAGGLIYTYAAGTTTPQTTYTTIAGTTAHTNPIVLDATARADILASGTNMGCRHLIDRQPELVCVHETLNTRFITDLDTQEDLQRLAERTGWKLELPSEAITP